MSKPKSSFSSSETHRGRPAKNNIKVATEDFNKNYPNALEMCIGNAKFMAIKEIRNDGKQLTWSLHAPALVSMKLNNGTIVDIKLQIAFTASASIDQKSGLIACTITEKPVAKDQARRALIASYGLDQKKIATDHKDSDLDTDSEDDFIQDANRVGQVIDPDIITTDTTTASSMQT